VTSRRAFIKQVSALFIAGPALTSGISGVLGERVGIASLPTELLGGGVELVTVIAQPMYRGELVLYPIEADAELDLVHLGWRDAERTVTVDPLVWGPSETAIVDEVRCTIGGVPYDVALGGTHAVVDGTLTIEQVTVGVVPV
jgi:hypothetical protein